MTVQVHFGQTSNILLRSHIGHYLRCDYDAMETR